MNASKDLVHILKLLDDDSASVRIHVWEKLQANLSAWEPAIRARLSEIPEVSRQKILDLLGNRARTGFRGAWLNWRQLPEAMPKLESALSGLSLFLSGTGTEGKVPKHPELESLLDHLAQDFRDTGFGMDAESLAEYLFTHRGFCGATSGYYDPANSDLVQVIQKRQGIPITLACIFMLVGYRLGLEIHGCDVPEHFLTRAREGQRDIIIDCFDGGKILDERRLGQLEMKYAPDFAQLLYTPASPEAIIARVLRNLINAYHLAGNKEASEFIWTLADDLRGDSLSADDSDTLV